MKKIFLLLPLLFVFAAPAMGQPRLPRVPHLPKVSPVSPARKLVVPSVPQVPHLPTLAPSRHFPTTRSLSSVKTPLKTETIHEMGEKIILPPMPGSFTQYPFLSSLDKEYPLYGSVGESELASGNRTAARNQRSLWEQMKRNYQARKLKKTHAQSVALAQAKAKLPQPVESEAFFTTTLLPFSPDRDARMTPLEFPFMEEPDVLYRGLALDNEGKSIANILENGLRTQDAGEESTTLLVAYASHSQNPNFLANVATRKVTNLTSSPTSARYWIGKRISTELPVPVITRVTDVGGGNWVTVHEDIPASQITVFAILKINNQARWCSIERATDATGQVGFKITPFEYRLRHE